MLGSLLSGRSLSEAKAARNSEFPKPSAGLLGGCAPLEPGPDGTISGSCWDLPQLRDASGLQRLYRVQGEVDNGNITPTREPDKRMPYEPRSGGQGC